VNGEQISRRGLPKQRCTAITRAGHPCGAWSVPGTDPPRCAAHRTDVPEDTGCPSPPTAPPGSVSTEERQAPACREAGRYHDVDHHVDLDVRIADLDHRIEQLSRYIDQLQVGPRKARGSGAGGPETGPGICVDVNQYARLLSVYGQLASRLGRLLRDKQQIAPEDESWLQLCFDEALDQTSEILGVKL
jgi:hypothetical protein